MNNQESKVRPEIINIKSNEPSFHHYSVRINKCSDSCNNINDPLAKLCVADVARKINLKLFNLMSRTKKARYIKLHETFKCAIRLDVSVCNNKQRWNKEKCRCEYNELINRGICG